MMIKRVALAAAVGACLTGIHAETPLEPIVLRVSNGAELNASAIEIAKIRKAERDRPVDVVLAGGDYELPESVCLNERVRDYRSSPTADVTFRAAHGARPRLCGGRRVTGWAKTSFNGRRDVWCADVSALKLKKKISLLYCDGTAMTLCRWPNADPKKPYSGGWAYVEGQHVSMYREIKGERDDEIRMRRADMRGWAHPEEAFVNIFPRYNWWNAVRPVAGIDVTPTSAVMRLARRIREGFSPRAYDRYCLMGLREELDVPGEWYHDLAAGKVYFIPPAGTDPNAVRTAVVPQPFGLFRFINATNIVVKGMEACEASSFVSAEMTSRVRISDCRVHDVGTMDATAISASGTYNEVRDCDVWNTQSYGISVSGGWNRKYAPETRDGNVVENNYIHHCGRMNRHGFGVNVYGQGSRVAHNLMHDMPRGGIFYSGRFLTLVKNRIRHVNLEMEDTAAIYGGGFPSNTGTKINGNHVSHSIGFSHDAKGKYEFRKTCAWGIYLDDCSGGAEVVGNLVDHCNGGGMHMHCARFNVVSNNVFISNGGLSRTPRQHSIRGWKITDGVVERYLVARCQKEYEQLLAVSPAWTNYIALSYPPAHPQAPNGLIMQGNRLVNNIWYYPDQPDSFVYTPGNYNPSNNLFDANILWPGTGKASFKLDGRDLTLEAWRKLGQDVRSVVADPLFRDPEHGDWSFRPGSPALALGIAPIRPQEAGLYLNENRRTFPQEAEGAREHPEWYAER